MSNNNDFTSELDAILAEFASYGDARPVEDKPAAREAAAPAASGTQKTPAPADDADAAEYYVDVSQLEDYLDARKRQGAPGAPIKKPAPRA